MWLCYDGHLNYIFGCVEISLYLPVSSSLDISNSLETDRQAQLVSMDLKRQKVALAEVLMA